MGSSILPESSKARYSWSCASFRETVTPTRSGRSARLAITLQAAGQLEPAGNLQVELVTANLETQGVCHLHTLAAVANLALTMQALGELDAALSMQEEVVRVLSEIQGERHLDTLTAMSNLAFTLQVLGELDAAARCKKRWSGRCARSRETVTSTCSRRRTTWRISGEPSGISTLLASQEEVLSVRREDLGPHDPDTILAAKSLAATLRALGDRKLACKLERDAKAAEDSS